MADWREAYGPGDPIPADAWVVDPADRTTYYGATDISAILGVNPFSSRIDVYLEKRDRRERGTSSWAKMGQRLEAAIGEAYVDLTGYAIRRLPAKGLYRAQWPLVRGHPDWMVLHEPGLVDAKSTERTSEYGEPGTDEVPARVRVQMTVYLGLSGREWCDVVVLPGATRVPPIYRLRPNPDLFEACMKAVEEFHEQHVLAGVVPAPDGSSSWREYVAERYGGDGEEMPPATPEQLLLVDELRAAVTAAARADRALELAKQKVMDLLGERVALPTSYGTITWRREAPRANPWDAGKALAESIGDPEAWRQALERDKASRKASRVFRHPFREGDA